MNKNLSSATAVEGQARKRTADWDLVLSLMLRSRRFDETLAANLRHVVGPLKLGIGQEGTAAAIGTSYRPGDALSLNHRNFHHLGAIGANAEVMYAEIFGRDRGEQRGKAGAIHLNDREHGVYYTSAMTGSCVPLAVGIAFAKSRRHEEGVSFVTFGDGAIAEGVVAESFNLAALWNAPVVFVCESNVAPADGHATPFFAPKRLTDLPAVYGIPTYAADATRPRAIVAVMADAAAAARSTGSAQFVLATTTPWPGDLGSWVDDLPPVDLRDATKPPVGWGASDPVLNEVRELLDEGVNLEAILQLDARITGEMRAAVAAAAKLPVAPVSAALEDVWEERSS